MTIGSASALDSRGSGLRRVLGIGTAALLAASIAAALLLPRHAPDVDLTAGSPAFVAAGRATGRSRTLRIALTDEVRTGPQRSTMTGSGIFDVGQNRGAVTLTVPGLGAIDVRVVDGTTYYRYPPAWRAGVGLPTEWAAIPATRSVGLSPSATLDAGSPSEGAAALAAGSDGLYHDVRSLGTDRVRGTRTWHYRAEVDALAYAQRLATAQGAPPPTASGPSGVLTFDFWLDRHGAMRRWRQEKDVASTPPTVIIQTTDFYDLGTRVVVNAPPATAVTRYSDITTFSQHLVPTTTSTIR